MKNKKIIKVLAKIKSLGEQAWINDIHVKYEDFRGGKLIIFKKNGYRIKSAKYPELSLSSVWDFINNPQNRAIISNEITITNRNSNEGKRFTQQKQWNDLELSGSKQEVKEKLALYIDAMPEFTESKLSFKGLVSMPRVEIIEPRFD